MKASEYVDQERREYSLYVLEQRAIPHGADGLRSASRRVLWVGRDGQKCKAANLAAKAIPIHPHASPESAVNTLAAPYGNNIPLLTGYGTFGTILDPTAYGAPRYTSAAVSKFTKDVVYRDIEIIPMKDNYDGTLQEPKHFLPLVPIVLLNPQNGVAVGFASSILPRSLTNIIKAQLAVLEGGTVVEETPELTPINQKAVGWVDSPQGWRAIFHGEFERTGATTIRITNLPYDPTGKYGTTHEKYRAKLDQMEDDGKILSYRDRSKKQYNIEVKFKRGILSKLEDDEILSMMGLVNNIPENLTVINFDGKTVWNPTFEELITEFCAWRLGWYKTRYQRLADLLEIDIQKYKDILLAIKKKVGAVAPKIASRAELKEFLTEIGIVHVDYIADLAVYRFTEEERKKTEERLAEAKATLAGYLALIKSEAKRRAIYVTELKEVLSNYKKGKYA